MIRYPRLEKMQGTLVFISVTDYLISMTFLMHKGDYFVCAHNAVGNFSLSVY